MTEVKASGPAAATAQNSRQSDEGAGWGCKPGKFISLMPPGKPPAPVYWFSAKILWETRNDFLAKSVHDPTNDRRRAWLAGVSPEELTLDQTRLADFSFLLVGDTGEGDASQYALIPALLQHTDTAFMLICSDVLYPIGNVNDYERKFYVPYKSYPGPVYAVPGNHDWYDGLEGFMRHFCAREPPAQLPRARHLSKARFQQRLWRKPAPFDEPTFERVTKLRSLESQRQLPPQRSPYFAIETQRLVLVCIDTGISKQLDRDQGAWVLDVSSRSPKPKVLLTGTPIYVNNVYQPLAIEDGGPPGFPTVDSMVTHRPHNYVAVIGGDIHNYQRYPVRVNGRTIQHIVSGGGGAFMHATHTIPKVTVGGVTEDEFKCYPLRRDSLAAYSRLFDRKLGRLRRGRRLLELTPDEAALYLRDERGFELTRPLSKDVQLRRGARRAAIATLLMPAERSFHKYLSPFFDWDTPPFFKNFLRLDVSERGLDIVCYGITGCRGRGSSPVPEDRTPTIPLEPYAG